MPPDDRLSRLRRTARIGAAGRRLSYLDTAATESAPPTESPHVLLLLHAFPLNATMWQRQLAAVPAGWRFIAPDDRGFGWSEDDSGEVAGEPPKGGLGATVDPSIDDYAKDVLALLDALDIRRTVVCGLSMGGYVAFALLRLASERIAGLVLADTKAEADSDEARKGRLDMIDVLNDGGVSAVIDRMVPRLLSDRGRHADPAIELQVRAIAQQCTPVGLADALIRMMHRPDSTELLERIQCPVLVIAGHDDSVTPPDAASRMQQRIPAARFALIPDAGHLSNIEQPAAFNDALTAFLATTT